MKPSIAAKLGQLSGRLEELTRLLSSESATADLDNYRKLTREHAEIAPLVELAILVKWLSLDPGLHRVLWFAESDATELTQIEVITEHLKLRGNTPTQGDPSQRELKERGRDEGRARLAAAGRDYGDRLMPTLAQMVEEVEAAMPGYRVAMRDAHDLAYRVLSPWQHTDASTFKSTAEALDAGGWKFGKDRSPFNVEDLKAMATAMYAFALETVLLGTKTGHPQIVRAVRDFVTLHWVRSDRLRAAVDKSAASEPE